MAPVPEQLSASELYRDYGMNASFDKAQLVVQYLNPVSTELRPSGEYLAVGRRLLVDAFDSRGWNTVDIMSASWSSEDMPSNSDPRNYSVSTLKSVDEEGLLNSLKDFDPHDVFLDSLSISRDLSNVDRVNRSSAELSMKIDSSRPRKRRRTEIDPDTVLEPLHDAIPLPHFLSSPMSTGERAKIAPYVKRQPICVPPVTIDEALSHLKTPYARSAWIVPIRGTPPWAECTTGAVVSEYYADSDDEIDPLTWTRASMESFWKFMLVLRERHSVGPLSLSFKPSVSLPSSFDAPRGGDRNNHRNALDRVDYFKIYHDAAFAMEVRQALDAWPFRRVAPNTATRKIRVLKSARLVLLNEKSEALLTC